MKDNELLEILGSFVKTELEFCENVQNKLEQIADILANEYPIMGDRADELKERLLKIIKERNE